MDETLLEKPIPVIMTNSCCAGPISGTLASVQAEHLADQMKALADVTRLRMLDLLVQQTERLCVCDITAQFDQHQPTISHHLRILREAGLVECEKRGAWAYYWATEVGKKRLSIVATLR